MTGRRVQAALSGREVRMPPASGAIKRSQPFDSPGSLTADEVYAVTAYLLYMNGLIGKDEVVEARTLPRLTMPNRDGFVPDPRPDVGKPSKTTRP
jgi:cytochrome c